MIILNSDRPKFCIHSLFLSRWYGVVKINWLNFRLKLTTVCNDHSLRIVFKNRKFQIYIVNNVSLILFSVLFSFSTLWIVLQRFYTAANLFGRVKSNSRLYEPYICCVVVLKPHCFPQLETKRIGFETKHRQIRYFNLRKTRGVTKCKIQVFSAREIEFLYWQGRVIRGSKLIFLDCFAF